MFCPQCGNSVNPSMNFCPYCSYSLKNINVNKDVRNNTENTYDGPANHFDEKIDNQNYYNNNVPDGSKHISENYRPINSPNNVVETNNAAPSFDAYRKSLKKEGSKLFENSNQRYDNPNNYNDQYNQQVKNNDYNRVNSGEQGNQQYENRNYPQRDNSYKENTSFDNNQYNENAQPQYDNYMKKPYPQDKAPNNYDNYLNKYGTQQTNYQNKNDYSSSENYRVNNSPDNIEKSDTSYGRNIYSEKNKNPIDKRANNPLIPPENYNPDLLAKTNKKSNHVNDDEEIYYDFEETSSGEKRFYNSWGFIIPMVVLVILAATIILHFLNIIDLTAIPAFFNKEPTEESNEELSSNSEVGEVSVDDKDFYIDAGNIEEIYADKIHNLNDEIIVANVSYFVNVDENLNIKKDDFEYIVVNIKVENTSNEIIYLNPFYFSIINENGDVYSPHQTENKMQIEEILANQRLNGSIPYKVPINEKKLYIVYSNSENLDLADFFIKYR